MRPTATCSWPATSTRWCASNTTRTGADHAVDAFGVLGEVYAERVWVMENTGYNDYDALNLSFEKRYVEQLVRPRVVLALEVARHRAKTRPTRTPTRS